MAYIKFKKLWESEFDTIICRKDKVQDIKFNQLKLKVNDTYTKDKGITTIFQPSNDENVINKAFVEKKNRNRGSFIIIRKRLQRI